MNITLSRVECIRAISGILTYCCIHTLYAMHPPTGMFKFIQRYVVDEAIPLTKLLLVFGIVTVSSWLASAHPDSGLIPH